MAYWWTVSTVLAVFASMFQYQILKKCPPRSIERGFLSAFVFGPMAISACCVIQAELKSIFPDVTLSAFLGSAPMFYAFHRLLCSDMYLGSDDVARTKKIDNQGQAVDSRTAGGLRQFYDIFTNVRRIGHPDQAKNVPRFGQWPNIPSKSQFVMFRGVRVGLLYVALDLMASTRENGIDMDKWTLPQLWENSFPCEDTLTAIVYSLFYWLNGYIILMLQHDMISIVAVMAGIDNPSMWPPMFGSIRQSYTIRKFWGTFWHQQLRLMLEGISSFMVHTVLLIPKPSDKLEGQRTSPLRLVTRYMKIVLAFGISGLLHVGSDVGIGVPLAESRALRFFLLQALGIVLEDVAEAAWVRICGGGESNEGISTLRKVLGYVWVLSYMGMTVPMWGVPISKASSDLKFVPISLFSKA